MSNRKNKKKKPETDNRVNNLSLNYNDYCQDIKSETEEKLSDNSSCTYINGIKRKVREYSRTRKCSCGGYIWTINDLNVCGHCQTIYNKVYSNTYDEDSDDFD